MSTLITIGPQTWNGVWRGVGFGCTRFALVSARPTYKIMKKSKQLQPLSKNKTSIENPHKTICNFFLFNCWHLSSVSIFNSKSKAFREKKSATTSFLRYYCCKTIERRRFLFLNKGVTYFSIPADCWIFKAEIFIVFLSDFFVWNFLEYSKKFLLFPDSL